MGAAEYPRPTMVRENWTDLNGLWEYAVTRDADRPWDNEEIRKQALFDGQILVPYAPEAPLSGVERVLMPDEYAHYRRIFTLEEHARIFDGRGRLLLHFGAVDQYCRVFVNNEEAGQHTGGYLPFTLDITDFVRAGENVLEVSVRDLTDSNCSLARGKQKLEHGGMWYTPVSGIWQTVWMEEVPADYIRMLKITPDLKEDRFVIRVLTASRKPKVCRVRLSLEGETLGWYAIETDKTEYLTFWKGEGPLPEKMYGAGHAEHTPRYWSPKHPVLYDLTIETPDDKVSTYAAMREVHVGGDQDGTMRIYLNNKPYFMSGVLDQGYWKDGLYTAPSDQAMADDIAKMKELGFNMLRKHIKIEPERWYYHCDRLGMLVWQDMVNGGSRYHDRFVTIMPNVLPWTQRHTSDRAKWLFSRKDESAQRTFVREMKETIRLLYNHPSVVEWSIFNEGWGQFDTRRIGEIAKKLDPTRPVDEASGWFDRGGGDFHSIHSYWYPLKVKKEMCRERAAALTEFGGYACIEDGHTFSEKAFGYRKYKDREALTRALEKYWEKTLIPAAKSGLSASVYTQLSDVEEECNGLMTYDREVVKVIPERIWAMNKKLREAAVSCPDQKT